VRRGLFNDAPMRSDRGVDQQSLRVLLGQQSVQGGIEERVIQMKVFLVFGAQGGVGIDDADQLCVLLPRESVQESCDMPVLEADDSHANGCLLSGEMGAEDAEDGDEQQGQTACATGAHRVMLPLCFVELHAVATRLMRVLP